MVKYRKNVGGARVLLYEEEKAPFKSAISQGGNKKNREVGRGFRKKKR